MSTGGGLRLVWYVCDFVTGDLLVELPLTATGALSRRMAVATSVSLTLPTAEVACPDDWAGFVVPGRTLIVACIEDDEATSDPVQGWALDDIAFGAGEVALTCSSLETCPARVFVPDYEPGYDEDLSSVAANVATPLATGFGFDVEWTACGRSNPDLPAYDSTTDTRVLAALNDLAAADGGPEWRIVLRWADPATRTRFRKVLQIAPRIGQVLPDVVFDLDTDGGGTIETYQRTLSYAEGKGATDLTGVSEGSGSARPMVHAESPLLAAGWPRWEERKNFTSLLAPDDLTGDEDAALASRTRATLAQREQGTTVWKVTGGPDAPVPGRDFSEGDTIRIDVAPQSGIRGDGTVYYSDPSGGTADVRVRGWDLDPATLRATPELWETGDTTDADEAGG